MMAYVTTPDPKPAAETAHRQRMTGAQRRAQLLEVGRGLFAERGFEATTIEEIAATAGVSKPVVYEHFGSKEKLYEKVVEGEVSQLRAAINLALTSRGHIRILLERAAVAFLTYVENSTDGFQVLVRDSPLTPSNDTYTSMLSEISAQVGKILSEEFSERGYNPQDSAIYAQMLVGMVALTGQWWLSNQHLDKHDVASRIINLSWNGLAGLSHAPHLIDTKSPDFLTAIRENELEDSSQ